MTDQSSPAPLSVSLGIVASRALHWLRWQRRAGGVLAGEEPWRGRRGGLTGAEWFAPHLLYSNHWKANTGHKIVYLRPSPFASTADAPMPYGILVVLAVSLSLTFCCYGCLYDFYSYRQGPARSNAFRCNQAAVGVVVVNSFV